MVRFTNTHELGIGGIDTSIVYLATDLTVLADTRKCQLVRSGPSAGHCITSCTTCFTRSGMNCTFPLVGTRIKVCWHHFCCHRVVTVSAPVQQNSLGWIYAAPGVKNEINAAPLITICVFASSITSAEVKCRCGWTTLRILTSPQNTQCLKKHFKILIATMIKISY